MINYHLYRDVFPVMALGRYRNGRRGDWETRRHGDGKERYTETRGRGEITEMDDKRVLMGRKES